ncbi:uncharacterized protein SAPINGB_P005348 [Magnusiomyces paraingens]|uniref:AB hydrolase-1 domain-containing protein n=1 Tax=Magnusiomyces paraingens TaxID=2606893 RepID=A0A5E8C4H7_9ASCO|nr:uncharacterized protein SAPINGB_P005348 [Saprochaete ingens]VVT56861.1 unnamed protein product [Saprochaete ingens]
MAFEDRTTNLTALATVATLFVSMFIYGIQKLQEMMVYPSNVPEGSRSHVDTPAKYGIPFDDIKITTPDGETLQAYIMVQPEEDEDEDEQPTRKTVVMFAPNAGNIGHTLPIAEILYKQMRYNVVTFSYRGYGLSTGKPSEAGIKIDAGSVLRYLRDHPVIKQTRLVLYGRSLGGAVAIYFASLPEASGFVSGIVLENTFLSIVKMIPEVVSLLRPLSFLCTQKWDSETTIALVPSDIKLLFLSGKKDELVPPAHHKKLFDQSRAKVKYFKSLPEGHHNNTVVQPNYWTYFYGFAAKCDPREDVRSTSEGLRVGDSLTQEELDEFLRDDENGKVTAVKTSDKTQWIPLSNEDAVKAASITNIKDVL